MTEEEAERIMQEEARKKELLSKENGTEMESSSKPVEEKEGEEK